MHVQLIVIVILTLCVLALVRREGQEEFSELGMATEFAAHHTDNSFVAAPWQVDTQSIKFGQLAQQRRLCKRRPCVYNNIHLFAASADADTRIYAHREPRQQQQ